jgi:hypothetical protein
MDSGPLQALRGALRPTPATRKPRLVIAGATGALGNEVMRRLVGGGAFESTQVLAREPIKAGLRGVNAHVVFRASGDGDAKNTHIARFAGIARWPPLAADSGVILFDPPRLFHDRERALWTPVPEQLVDVARWMRAGGATTLAVVLPHVQGRLPEALKRGLAGLDEQAVAALGFERLLFIRSPQKPGARGKRGFLDATAHWMLGVFRYMIPSSEQPVRAVKVAQFVAAALRHAPPGIHVAAPELVWRAAQGDVEEAARDWLDPRKSLAP